MLLTIKNIFKLQKNNYRKFNKYIIVEGYLEIKMALIGKFKLIKILICKNIFFKKNKKINFKYNNNNIFYINIKQYKKLTYRKKTEGILGIFYKKKINYKKKFKKYINNKNNKIILIIDNIEKPGNIGSIIRTIEATKIINFIIIINKKEIYNPNIIRSSLGCVFLSKILILKFNYIKKNIFLNKNFIIIGTSIYKKNNICLYKINFNKFKKNICIILGNEHNGISKNINNYINFNINIPMYGKINSLNVSNSFAIIIYELLRNKKFI
ncbi:MAG: rRNA methyltransferase [Flavobacteriales endosymbiont of Rhyzopertha dominica]|nr:MAG: RNA methyltransferase [Candidatus Shikimatogenerans bostrichidophilus]